MTSPQMDTQTTIARILRVNDAGERGGVMLYKIQLFVARWRCPEVVPFLEWTRDHEADHAKRFRALMPSRKAKVCRLPWIWHLGAIGLGLFTAIFGARCVYLCTEIIETSVHSHLEHQYHFARLHDVELAELIRSVQADEMDHLNRAVALRNGGRVVFQNLLDPVVTALTDGLIWLSTRGDAARLKRRLEGLV